MDTVLAVRSVSVPVSWYFGESMGEGITDLRKNTHTLRDSCSVWILHYMLIHWYNSKNGLLERLSPLHKGSVLPLYIWPKKTGSV